MAHELPPLPVLPLGRYRHYKGGEYEVVGVVRHSESLEPMVLYRPLYNRSGSWVRPFAMFVEDVEHEGRRMPRFSVVNASAPAAGDDQRPRAGKQEQGTWRSGRWAIR